MLVLTTMFINVSNNLPKTSYVKMIDIWLIFNLLLPFIEVLVHTYMDSLRHEQNPSLVENLPRNDEDREINHHGRPVEVAEAESRRDSSIKVADFLLNASQSPIVAKVADLVAVNEQVQLKALTEFYDKYVLADSPVFVHLFLEF